MSKTRRIKHQQIYNKKGSQLDYYPNWLPFSLSIELFDKLKHTLPLETKHVTVFGRTLPQPRLTSWHGDMGKSYTYSGLTVNPDPWTSELSIIRSRLIDFTGYQFNSVLVNYYRDGQDCIGIHSDNEQGLGPAPDNVVIASVSLGEARNFVLRNNETKEVFSLDLQYGSLLVMAGQTQKHFTHEVPRTKRQVKDRLNLTFRVII